MRGPAVCKQPDQFFGVNDPEITETIHPQAVRARRLKGASTGPDLAWYCPVCHVLFAFDPRGDQPPPYPEEYHEFT